METYRCSGCKAVMDATASICIECRNDLVRALVDVSAHFLDLRVVEARLTRYSTARTSSRSADTPLPYDARFATYVDHHGNPQPGRGTELLRRTRTITATWAQTTLDAHPTTPPAGPTCTRCLHQSCRAIRDPNPPWTGTVADACLYLIQHADWIRTSPHGGQILRDLTRLNTDLAKLVDRPPDGWFAGICAARIDLPGRGFIECPHELYATEKAGQIKCRACKTIHDVVKRREILLTMAESILATTTEIARAVVAWSDYDQPTKRIVDRIWLWADKGRLEQRGTINQAGRDRPMYRMGDVLDLLADDVRQAAKPRPKAKVTAAS